MNKGSFVQHCDNPECDLGSFDFICPSCKHYVSDYDIWFKQIDIFLGEEIRFNCSSCKKDLIVFNEDYESIVKVNDQN